MALGDQKSNQEAYIHTPSFLTIDSRRAQPNKKKHSCVCVGSTLFDAACV
jgi:hypothetical protein